MRGCAAVILLVTVLAMATLSSGATIGIDLGLVSNQLPPISEIVQLLKSRSVTNVRIYDASVNVLKAFVNQGIAVSVTVPNPNVVSLANNQQAATDWVKANVQPFASTIDRVAVGNEWLNNPSNDPSKLLLAMQNVNTALTSLGVNKKVTTAHAYDIVDGFPPSAGTFKNAGVMTQILAFLKRTDSAFMVNIYPYFTYSYSPNTINLNYALGNAGAPSVKDSGSGKTYTNLMDAQIDTVISAMKRVGYGDVRLILGETGWPSAGGMGATVNNAKAFNQNIVKQALGGKGTPLWPGVNIRTYIFALFNENLKTGPDVERNFGLYYPTKKPVYDINLSV